MLPPIGVFMKAQSRESAYNLQSVGALGAELKADEVYISRAGCVGFHGMPGHRHRHPLSRPLAKPQESQGTGDRDRGRPGTGEVTPR